MEMSFKGIMFNMHFMSSFYFFFSAIDGCILKKIKNECNKKHEICVNGECQCKENYKYSHDNETCEGKYYFCSLPPILGKM